MNYPNFTNLSIEPRYYIVASTEEEKRQIQFTQTVCPEDVSFYGTVKNALLEGIGSLRTTRAHVHQKYPQLF